MLIKLTGVPHPDLNGGRAQPVYIDASRVLLIAQGHHRFPKIGSVERHKQLYDRLYQGSSKLSDLVNAYIPKMTDPIAVEWMSTAREAAGCVNDAYRAWAGGWREEDYHPSMDCTEVQLACGTALEHGVMLTRVWVSDPIEDVAKKVAESRTVSFFWPRKRP